MAHVHAIDALAAADRAVVDREDHGVALAQGHDLDARLHARPLLGQDKLAALEVAAGLVQQDRRLQEYKGFAAIAFARANKINRVTMDSPNARFGIMASGKSYEDMRQALRELGITPEIAARIGLRLYKIGMPWPLEPQGVREFAVGLEEIFIVEERREIVENQVKQELFNWRDDVRPRIVGKMDEHDKRFLPFEAEITEARCA